MTVTAGERLHLWKGGPCIWGIISISARELISYGQAVISRNFRLSSDVCRLQPSQRGLQSLMALFASVVRLTEAQPSAPIQTDRAIKGLDDTPGSAGAVRFGDLDRTWDRAVASAAW
jgi:hypothetical protein